MVNVILAKDKEHIFLHCLCDLTLLFIFRFHVILQLLRYLLTSACYNTKLKIYSLFLLFLPQGFFYEKSIYNVLLFRVVEKRGLIFEYYLLCFYFLEAIVEGYS